MTASIDDKLRAAIAGSGLSANALSKECGVLQTTISRFMRGENMGIKCGAKIARHLRLELTTSREIGRSTAMIDSKLRAAIKVSGKSQSELAKATGIPRTSINRFMAGTDMGIGRAGKIAKYLKLELR